MKRTHIKDVLQVTVALLITGGMASAMTPPPVTDTQASINRVVTAKPKTSTPVTANSAPANTPVAPAPTIWQDNPNHCDQNTQYIAADAPFSCIAKPTQAAPAGSNVAVSASVGCGDPHAIMAAAGVSEAYFGAVDYIVSHEGTWCGATRYNTGGSGAYGICQALPGGKMASAGADWATNPVTQLRWCDSYANARYGGWWNAYNFWLANHLW